MNINGETIGFPLEQIVNCGASNSHKLKNKFCLVWFCFNKSFLIKGCLVLKRRPLLRR
jgi:hypothetical protein